MNAVKNIIDGGVRHIYNFIHKARQQYFNEHYPRTVEFVEKIREDHARSAEALELLRNWKELGVVKEFLHHKNKCYDIVDEGNECRTLVLLDATGSMEGVISLTKQTIAEMFKRVFAILEKAEGLSFQMGAYRNYNSPDDLILELTDWESKADNLFTFLDKVRASGGWGREAAELGLYHGLQENAKEPITQIIVIGDAPPNTSSESHQKRKDKGYNYPRFPDPILFSDVRKQLENEGVVVHAFYVPTWGGESERMDFHKMAVNGGKQHVIDIHKSDAADALMEAVCKRVLFASATSQEKGDEMIEKYNKLYGNKGYT